MTRNSLLKYKLVLWLLLAVLGACDSNNDDKTKRYAKPKTESMKLKLSSPGNGSIYRAGDSLYFEFETDVDLQDSKATLVVGNMEMKNINSTTGALACKDIGLGTHMFQLKIEANGKKKSKVARVVILAEQAAENQGFSIVNTYPHDKEAYTQGLFWHEGFLFEGTGQRGMSKLKKVVLETGNSIQEKPLKNSLFGEGITLWKDQIFQLTWKSQVALVYNAESFELEKTFSYSGEGWGLCTMDSFLVMSNGSHELSVRNPENFKEINRIQVVDNEKVVRFLNELEFINGEIWANVYQSAKIARIDPKTGRVIAYINLGGILDRKDIHSNIDVLNGIAYDKENDRVFVTGKNWPKIFEIKVGSKEL